MESPASGCRGKSPQFLSRPRKIRLQPRLRATRSHCEDRVIGQAEACGDQEHALNRDDHPGRLDEVEGRRRADCRLDVAAYPLQPLGKKLRGLAFVVAALCHAQS